MEFADWTRAFAMVGKYGTEWVPVLLAEDGSMYALLQGMTPDDELRTVRLDDEGRLSAFIIDSSDAWGQMLSVGNAELAARLGSPVIYEQSGRVQFVESFEQGLARWHKTINGDAAGIEISPTYFMSGGYSVKLTGGSDSAKLARIEHHQGGLPLGTVGLAFAYSTHTDFDNVIADLYVWDTENLHQMGVKLDGVNDKLWVRVGADDWQEVAENNPYTNGANRFFFVKLTADMTTNFYTSLRFNQEEVPVSAYSPYLVAVPFYSQIKVLIEVTSAIGNDIIYVDDVILTGAEP